MLKIHVRNVDALQALLNELGVYTYFQGLLQVDRTENLLGAEQMQYVRRFAENYLWSQQRECVMKLKALVESDTFTCHEDMY